jgi:hypothetical protein
VSILNRLSRAPHLDDAALAAIWADACLAGSEASHPHLAGCAPCRARMDAFVEWMEAIRTEDIAEADEAFPAERLAAQQAHIFRRLEAAERPARVIAFPTFTRPMSSGASHIRRWVAAGAAAGLIVGVGLGQLMDLRHTLKDTRSSAEFRTAEPPRSDRPSPRIQPVSATLNDSDDAFMADIDASLSRNSLAELHAMDAITPRAPLFEGRQR